VTENSCGTDAEPPRPTPTHSLYDDIILAWISLRQLDLNQDARGKSLDPISRVGGDRTSRRAFAISMVQ
jgi:hypothetical protein